MYKGGQLSPSHKQEKKDKDKYHMKTFIPEKYCWSVRLISDISQHTLTRKTVRGTLLQPKSKNLFTPQTGTFFKSF